MYYDISLIKVSSKRDGYNNRDAPVVDGKYLNTGTDHVLYFM